MNRGDAYNVEAYRTYRSYMKGIKILMSNFVVLRTYPDKLHAELAASYLESEGIESFVSSPSQLPGSYLIAEWGDGMIPHELKVAEEDLAAAQAALAETEAGLDEDWDTDGDTDAVSGSDAAEDAPAETFEAKPTTDQHAGAACPTCGGPRDADDPHFAKVRLAMNVMIGLFALAAVAFFFVSGSPYFAMTAVLWVALAGAFLVLRAYFIRSRCGGCGHYRVKRRSA